MAHNFAASLEFSHSGRHLPLWREVYGKVFPGMVGMFDHRDDGAHQRAGIDRSIIMPTGKQIWIDEKLRRKNRNGNVYTDIALEYLSNEERQSPGWVCKNLLADYIAYAIAPLGLCYVMPVIQLQAAWRESGNEWIARFGSIRARNADDRTGHRWTTVSVCVPPKVVFKEISRGRFYEVKFTPCDEGEPGSPIQ